MHDEGTTSGIPSQQREYPSHKFRQAFRKETRQLIPGVFGPFRKNLLRYRIGSKQRTEAQQVCRRRVALFDLCKVNIEGNPDRGMRIEAVVTWTLQKFAGI